MTWWTGINAEVRKDKNCEQVSKWLSLCMWMIKTSADLLLCLCLEHPLCVQILLFPCVRTAQITQWGLTCVTQDRVSVPWSWSPIYGTDVLRCRAALAAAASPDSLTPPWVHAILVLGLLAALIGGGGSCATMIGASASLTWSGGCGCRGWGWGRSLDNLIQSGALP